MAIAYPLSLPAAWKVRHATIRAASVVGYSESPFTKAQQVYVHQGECWSMEVQLARMNRAQAEDCIATLISLNGVEGTILMPPPGNRTGVRGTWAGSPKVFGAHAAGVKTIAMDGYTAAATVKAGDWFQTGTGSNTHLHKIMQDGTADGSGNLNLEIWPRTRAALADNDTFTINAPVGLWRLAQNVREWDVDLAQVMGLSASFIEALSS